MSNFVIQTVSGNIKQTKSVAFKITDIRYDSNIRISFENATNRVQLVVNNEDKYIYLNTGISEVSGELNLSIPEQSSHAAISIYATIETVDDKNNHNIVEMSSAVYFITEDISADLNAKVSMNPAFVGLSGTSQIQVEGESNSRYVVSINDKYFSVLTGETGNGSLSFIGGDVVEDISIKVLQKFPVKILFAEDNYKNSYFSGSYLHIFPSSILPLAECTSSEPSNLELSLAALSPPSLETELPDRFVNFPVPGFDVTTDTSECADQTIVTNDKVYSVIDTSLALLPNGMTLVAYVGRLEANDYGRVFVKSEDSSLTERVYPIRYGAIPSISTHLELYVEEEIFDIAQVGWDVVIYDGAVNYGSFEILEKRSPVDGGNEAYALVFGSTEISDRWRTCVPYVLVEKNGSACTPELNDSGPEYYSLPYVQDDLANHLNAIKVSVGTNRGEIDTDNSFVYIYFVVEALVGSVSQLFFCGWRTTVGSSCSSFASSSGMDWHQLTFSGENKNPSTVVDEANNLHIFWESDRGGTTQLYYSVLGPSSVSIANVALSSAIDKQVETFNKTIKPFDYTTLPIVQFFNDPTAVLIDKTCSGSGSNTMWLPYVDENGGVDVINNNAIDIVGNAAVDEAMAFTILDKDVNNDVFDGEFDQRSFQISFNLTNNTSEQVYSNYDIDQLYEAFKSSYIPSYDEYFDNANKYLDTNGNEYVLGKIDRYYDRFIPIVGSYKNTSLAGLFSDCEVSTNDQFVAIASNSNATLRHFMIGLMPEQVRFESTNVRSFAEFCEIMSCTTDEGIDLYSVGETNIVYTGRYKLVVIMNAQGKYLNSPDRKQYSISREIGNPFSIIDSGVNIKIIAHYRKMFNEDNNIWFGNTITADPNEYRFISSLNVAINDEMQFSESFLVDLTDEHRSFEIGIGFPSIGQFISNEFQAYESAVYEYKEVDWSFTDIKIGSPSIKLNSSIVTFPSFYRNFNEITVASTSGDETTPVDYPHSLIDFNVSNNGFVEIPLTFEGMNKSVKSSLGFICNDIHIAWQSNRYDNWDIFYTNSTPRAMPFRFDTRITKTESDSLMPSVAISSDSSRLITWHEMKDDNYQIFAARSAANNDLCNLGDCTFFLGEKVPGVPISPTEPTSDDGTLLTSCELGFQLTNPDCDDDFIPKDPLSAECLESVFYDSYDEDTDPEWADPPTEGEGDYVPVYVYKSVCSTYCCPLQIICHWQQWLPGNVWGMTLENANIVMTSTGNAGIFYKSTPGGAGDPFTGQYIIQYNERISEVQNLVNLGNAFYKDSNSESIYF